ncbi:hypothetical protein [Falsiroseomonas ponticola]|uniref:hypothetical protein n=1 Tax=Falsiroseomonas ponticola TaxID=2786951 RepID=UPI00193273A2|nr:hypothetical protein [Roseomonas ponticola]
MIAILRELDRRQPTLARLGWGMAAVLAASLMAMLVDGRGLNGVSVWTKPAKFAASLAVWCWTLAWAWGVLAPAVRDGWVARVVLWGTVAAALFEQGWITLRAALGLRSHFATDALGAFMFGVMGAAALGLVLLAAVLGLLVLARGDAAQPRPWRMAVGLGLVVAGVMGGVTGFAIGGHGSPLIGGTLSDAGAWPPFFWSRDGGDLRIAHFLGTHAMQAVPAFALLASPGVAGVVLAALAWLALSLAAFAAALAGIPLMP